MHRPGKRRWLQFSLRSMFALWTAVAFWLGWNMRVVHQRKLLRKELAERGVATFSGYSDARLIKAMERRLLASQLFAVDPHYRAPLGITGYIQAYENVPPAGGDLSWLRRCFGDEPTVTITLDARFELPRVQRMFPEATIRLRPREPVRTLPENEPQEQRLPVASHTRQDASWS
jgi:hypothetical protein